jgi:hypothetical protein
MPAPVTALDLVVGCVADDRPRFHQQALRLARSIRWFGGELARAQVLVCAVGGMPQPVRRELEGLGAEVRVVRRFHERNGSSNRLRLFEEIGDQGCDLLALDCDTLVVRDPTPLLVDGRPQARIAPLATVTHDVFVRLFRHYGIPLPPQSHLTGWTRTPTIPYFNAGVLFLPAGLAQELAPVWGRFNRELADRTGLSFPCEKHMHQASLALALAVLGISFEEAPFELNYQLTATHLEPPEGFLAIDPAILHYHEQVDPDGYLLPPPYPLARLRSEIFNQCLREERGQAPGRPATAATSPTRGRGAQVTVLSMHRAGSSAVTRLLNLAGLSAGPEERLPIPDAANPKGYWENSDVVILDDALLAALGTTWSDPPELDLDLGRLPAGQRRAFEARARELIRQFDAQGPWIFKDPRLCLLFPFWRQLLERPFCVLIYRDPLPVARSLEDRDGFPLPLGFALWELYLRGALVASQGLPRILVSYHELVANPGPALSRLIGELSGLGVEGLRQPDAAEIEDFLEPALDRHPRDRAAQRAYLNLSQIELLEALESGAALDLDPVPALSASARDTLAVHRDHQAERRRLRRSLDYRDSIIAERESLNLLENHDRDELLEAVFGSRSWRIGHGISRLLRWASKPAGPSAFDRWRSL